MKKSTANDDSRFDRLVDGDLSEEERRNLLAGMDTEPGGWRKCALAFLEAQCWKESFRGMARGVDPDNIASSRAAGLLPIAEVSKRSKTPSGRRKKHWLSHVQTAMATAACVMAALLIGSYWSSEHNGLSIATTGPSADSMTSLAASDIVPHAAGPGYSTATGQQQPEASEPPWQMVTLTSPSGELRLPAVERQNVDDAWLQSVPSAVPEEVLQALTRTGHRVQQQRELVPVPLKDGRRLVVPVDKVEVNYIGNETF